jgi:hypothetical protein
MACRFDAEFIETRRQALESFLRRVAQHSALGYDATFLGFLSSEQWVAEGKGMKSKMEDKLKNIATAIRVKSLDQRFMDVSNYAQTMGDVLTTLAKLHMRLSDHEGGVCVCVCCVGAQISYVRRGRWSRRAVGARASDGRLEHARSRNGRYASGAWSLF